MKASELRVGNFINHIDFERLEIPIIKVFHLDNDVEDRTRINYCGSELYQPIPLTEEWLVKFGFEKVVYDSEKTGYGIEYELKCNSDVFMVYADDFSLSLYSCKEVMGRDLGVLPFWGSVKTVHGLQNLYHALTGEELTIAEKMKSEIVGESQEKQDWKFPCLGVSDGLVVLFESKSIGLVMVSDSKCYKLGYRAISWNMDDFKLLPKGEYIQLEND